MLRGCAGGLVRRAVLLFSMVWYWNDSYYVSMYFDNFQTVSSKLSQLSVDIYRLVAGVDATNPFTMAV